MADGVVLLGREEERRHIEAVLARARNGRGGALLLAGEPGIGKTTLLNATTSGLPDNRVVLRADGFEAESQMPFAAVQRLLVPLRPHMRELPERHSQALRIASGEASGPPPDRFLVGLGVLGLLAAASASRPVVCAIDDAHHLDPESLDVLTFVARRIEAESAAVIFAARDAEHLVVPMVGVPPLRLEGLRTESAVKLLGLSSPTSLDPTVALQIAVATGGNPLALTDLAGELSARQLTESSLGEEPLPVGRHLESFYLRQVRLLGEDVQLWLLAVAADSTGNVDLITAASKDLGIPDAAWDTAEAAGLVEVGPIVRFRHPLVRSAAYNAASGRDRRRVHRSLSEVADAMGLPERSAWHAAKATLGTDEGVARRLEAVADLAGQRGGFASRAAVLARASALSPGRARHRRLVAAAEAALAAGRGSLAKGLLDDVDEGELDEVWRGRLISLTAQLAMFTADPEVIRGPANLVRAADMFQGRDDRLEQDALFLAWQNLLATETATHGMTTRELGLRMRSGAMRTAGTHSVVLEALSALVLLPYADAVPVMRRAVDVIAGLEQEEFLKYGHASVALTTALWDNERRTVCLRGMADAARDAGSLQSLDIALWVLSISETLGGTPRRAAEYIEQVRALRRAIGFDAEHVVNVGVLAWQGVPRDQVIALADGAAAMGFAGVQSASLRVVAIVDLAQSEYELCYRTVKPLIGPQFLHTGPLSWPDLVEAAIRTGRRAEAVDLAAGLRLRADLSGSDWLEGVAERCRALVADNDHAETHFQRAIGLLADNPAEVDLARTHLLYGEWLRRVRRRRDAYEQLTQAADLFDRSGAGVFLPRVNHELQATGGNPLSTRIDDLGLTAQEATVATLAAAGSTNAEIGATLFISGNTVDYHLRKVFQKLGISSRRQLADRLAKRASPR